MTDIEILNSCFHSTSTLWQSFASKIGNLNTLYYPSAGEDMRPFVFSNKENLIFMGLDVSKKQYEEPDFYIFSDYFPFSNARFFDSKCLHRDSYTEVFIQDYCELLPTNNYIYGFNKEYVHFEPSQATGKAIFFKAKVTSHKVKEPYYKYGIYFFYENVNLIEQLFLKNKLTFSHVVWKRDGSGFGGGSVRLDFIYHLAYQSKTKYFFVWDHYLNEHKSENTNKSYDIKSTPKPLRKYLNRAFSLNLEKQIQLTWEKQDRMNLYFIE